MMDTTRKAIFIQSKQDNLLRDCNFFRYLLAYIFYRKLIASTHLYSRMQQKYYRLTSNSCQLPQTSRATNGSGFGRSALARGKRTLRLFNTYTTFTER